MDPQHGLGQLHAQLHTGGPMLRAACTKPEPPVTCSMHTPPERPPMLSHWQGPTSQCSSGFCAWCVA